MAACPSASRSRAGRVPVSQVASGGNASGKRDADAADKVQSSLHPKVSTRNVFHQQPYQEEGVVHTKASRKVLKGIQRSMQDLRLCLVNNIFRLKTVGGRLHHVARTVLAYRRIS